MKRLSHQELEVRHERVAGLDVHQASVSICLIMPGADGKPVQEIRRLATTTRALLELADWLVAAGVTEAMMESTGVYWRPVWNILEAHGVPLRLANAHEVKNLPGKKTDTADCAWLAQLARHGLVRASFVPPEPVRELRALARARATLMGDRARVANRIQKLLEDMNIKLASVVTDVLGVSGRAMLQAMAAGETDATQLAELAQGRLRPKVPELREALDGRTTAHHRFLLAQLLAQLAFLDAQVATLEAEMERTVGPFERAVAHLLTVPGVDVTAARAIVAEIGTDMSRFATARHLASWACVCPGNHESAGQRASGHTRLGARWLRTTLVQCAWAATHAKKSYLAARYRRLAAKRGTKRALMAVAHTLLVGIWHMLRDGTDWRDLGPDHLARHDEQRLRHYHQRKLEKLGYQVTLTPVAA